MREKSSRKIRFDVATPLGLVVALGAILIGLIAEKGEPTDILQATAALIVFGGTLGAVLVTTPVGVFLAAMRRLVDLVLVRAECPEAVVETLVRFAVKARRQGIVSLEEDANQTPDPFLRRAMGLAVDGTPLHELRRQMELEISLEERRADAEARVYETAGGYAPTIGIIGAVMGLIQVMKRLDNLEEVGHGIAVAFVATIYGVGIANLLLLPAANKLRARTAERAALQELILDGVASIVEGMNPKLIRMRLEAYLEESSRGPSPGTPSPRVGSKAA